MRQLASIQRINGIYPIEGRDRIVQYGINGWKVIDQVGKYAVGDLVVYLEVDSWVPNALAPFLTKKGDPRVFEDVPGERLKTIKMGGALSQGLLLPLSVLQVTDFLGNSGWPMGMVIDEDTDVTEFLGILKWERSPEFRAANAKGDLPYFLRKTDQERIQNVKRLNEVVRRSYEVTEKLEGQSFTAFIFGEETGVCSRNLQLKMDEASTWRDTFFAYDLGAKLRQARDILGADVAFQGEQVGPGIEGNIYGFYEVKLFIFDVWDITNQRYLLPKERRDLLAAVGLSGVPYVGELIFPDGEDTLMFKVRDGIVREILSDGEMLQSIRQALLAAAYRCSDLAPVVSEGLVFKSNIDDYSFKAVSDEYLLHDKVPTPWKG